jgi:hypothetical protein
LAEKRLLLILVNLLRNFIHLLRNLINLLRNFIYLLRILVNLLRFFVCLLRSPNLLFLDGNIRDFIIGWSWLVEGSGFGQRGVGFGGKSGVGW